MSGIPIGPQHLSHQALLGPLPPRGMESDTWQDAYDAVDTMLATSFSNSGKQASLFEVTAKSIVRAYLILPQFLLLIVIPDSHGSRC